ncbi:MerR family transcriptional regulator [Tissierella creatinini]|nr:MerR family transcriptional regulator [Tissierella creatinini]TJX69121.1 MerR family transcriptional regulator [Soehngenia saccharolytica]
MDFDVEYTISEVADITGYAPHVLRYYEKEFEIDVPRTESNHRYYTVKEIELIQYIKMLQDKGFSNKQIKLIINSPELMVAGSENNGIQSVESGLDASSIAVEISKSLEEIFFERLNELISRSTSDSIEIIMELKHEIIELKQEINSKERDVLICENAKLKMLLKEKVSENLDMQDRLKKYEEIQPSFFKRLFGAKAHI